MWHPAYQQAGGPAFASILLSRVPHPNVVLFDVRVGTLTLLWPTPNMSLGVPAAYPLQPFLPISGAAVTMSKCQDLQARTLFPIGECEREPLQHKSAGAVFAGRPTPRRLHH